MFKPTSVFNGFSVDDLITAKEFYTKILGLNVEDATGGTSILLPGGHKAWMYAKENHQPALYTMLNFVVDDIDDAVDELTIRGVSFERYEGSHQDEKGIMRGKEHHMGPNIAWFKDSAGNILSVLEV